MILKSDAIASAVAPYPNTSLSEVVMFSDRLPGYGVNSPTEPGKPAIRKRNPQRRARNPPFGRDRGCGKQPSHAAQ